MNKLISIIAIITIVPSMIFAEMINASFGEKKHQVSAHFGISNRDFERIEDLYFWELQYSQANKIFMLPGRISVEFILQRGIGDFSKFDELMAGLSQDLILPVFGWLNPKPISNLYVGANLGIYTKTNHTDRISSLFTFGEKVFLGYRIKELIALEIYYRHYSNGTLTDTSSGYDFIGLTVAWNFSSKGK